MYKTFPATTYSSCIFHESEPELKHINIKIPRSTFLKAMFQKKKYQETHFHMPSSLGQPPESALPSSLPLFHWPVLTSPCSLLSFIPIILFIFLFPFYLLFLPPHPLPPLHLPSPAPSLPSSPFPFPTLPNPFSVSFSGGTQIIFFCTFPPIHLCQGFLLCCSHLTKGAQSHITEDSKWSTGDPGFVSWYSHLEDVWTAPTPAHSVSRYPKEW